MVTRMVMSPASIFYTVRGLRSASSARRCCVSPRAIRSRRSLSPKVCSACDSAERRGIESAPAQDRRSARRIGSA